MRKTIQSFLSIVIVFISINVINAQSKIEIGHIGPGEVASASFELNSETQIQINTVAASFSNNHFWDYFTDNDDWNQSTWSRNLIFYGWILDSETREVVWHFIDKHSEILRKKSEYMHTYEDKISLPAGKYEVYYTGARNNMNSDTYNNNSRSWLDEFLGLTDPQFNSKYSNKLYMTISSENNSLIKTDIGNELKKMNTDNIFTAVRVMNSENISKEFSLNKTTSLNIYALGEGRKSGIFDYAWIYDLDKNKIVWMINYDNTISTGGAEKNILFNDDVALPAGNYKISYKTDDSHSFNHWNTFPPDDPFHWGIVVKIPKSSERGNYREITNYAAANPIVQISSVRNDEYKSQGFSLNKSIDIHIVCLGEGFQKDDLADYGTIIDADTRQTVWEMSPSKITSAGGANKNRLVDETVHLEKGNYIASYVTDDSHAFNDWNDAEPFEPDLWGITIWAVNNSDKKFVSTFDENNYKNKNVITQIVRVRDYAYENKTFELRNDTEVRIYAIGEGTGGRMVDYGWIENNETGKVIWDMSYRRTENAGGARKNRMINETIILPKGNYNLFYSTDDSHSFGDWNDYPPVDRNNYGITVSYVNK